MERPRGGREKKRSTFLVLVVGTLLNSHCGVAIVQYPLVVLLPRKKVKHETLRKTASVERGGVGEKSVSGTVLAPPVLTHYHQKAAEEGRERIKDKAEKVPRGVMKGTFPWILFLELFGRADTSEKRLCCIRPHKKRSTYQCKPSIFFVYKEGATETVPKVQ